MVKKFSVDSMKFKERGKNVFKMLMEICEDGFTDMDHINMVIHATLFFILDAFWC